jgi:TolB-like protein/thioredoxin-like negative regulator of GroEL
MAAVSDAPDDRLDSWKAIATYLDRGVRTVRRWEHEEGLPVHRHMHHTLGSVYAFKSEIDAWRRTDARRQRPAAVDAPAGPRATQSIAVLPFTNLSTDPENAYFADGLTDEIIAQVSALHALRVISRTSSMTFKGSGKDLQTIARELGVRYVLEGSVRRAGARLRITAQLIDAATDDHLWSDTYDGSVEDVFAFQERLARVIVDALKVRLNPDEDRRLAERPIDNLQAYELYLRARQQRWRWRKDAIDQAVQLLQRALDLTGDNATLYAALGLAHLQYRETGLDGGEGPLDAADACAERVAALGPMSASALQLRGWIRYARGGIQDAVRDLKAALAIDPNNADSLGLLANLYLISGQAAAARPTIARLIAVDPLTPVNRCMPGFADMMEGRFAEALEPYRQMFEMDPGNPMARMFYVYVLILNQQTEAAATLVDTFPAEVRDTLPARLAMMLTLAAAGRAADVDAMVTPQMAASVATTDLFPRYLAQCYALAGVPDRALYWLEIAIARGFINYPFMATHDPFFAAMRSHPRFVELMTVARNRWSAFEV